MTIEQTADAPDTAQSWDAYWQGTAEVGAWTAGGVSHPAIAAFWQDFFRTVRLPAPQALLDIASGNGSVIDCAMSVLGETSLDVTCVDISESAVAGIRRRFPNVRGVVCDAASLPLDGARFDIVTSQFGVEYAGLRAVEEAARMPASQGWLALLLHYRGGVIHGECAASLEAIGQTQRSRFIPLAIDMFQAGFAAVRGADRAPYDEAARCLAPAAEALEAVVKNMGEHAAGGTMADLYAGVARIHSRLPNYDPDEVLGWLQRMESELDAYAGRMSSMIGSAIDRDAFEAICTAIDSRGWTVKQAGPLTPPGQELPLAWALVARAR